MTIVEAQNYLLEFFLENETFDLEEDIDTVIPKESITRELDQATFVAALDLLVEQEVVVELDLEVNRAWVLIKPLTMRSQTVELGFPVLKAVVDTINDYSEATGGAKTVVDVFNVNEKAIGSLVQIIANLSNLIQKK